MSKGLKTTTDDTILKRLVSQTSEMEKLELQYGWDDRQQKTRGSTNADVMYWFEMGTYQNGQQHQVPRPLLDQTSVWLEDEVANKSNEALSNAVFNKQPIRSALNIVAIECKNQLDNNMTAATSFLPRNKQSTIDQKGFDHPSIETGEAQDAISSWIVKKT